MEHIKQNSLLQILLYKKASYVVSKREILQALTKIYDLKGLKKRNLVAFL